MKQNNKHIIPASAMGYAISFLLLTGLICSGVLFSASVNKRLEVNYELEEHMLFNNYFGLYHGACMPQNGSQLIVHTSGDSSKIIKKPWGIFQSVTATTFHKNRTIKRSALVGFELKSKLPALYLPNKKQKLNLCGETKLEGKIVVPERSLQRGRIAGKNYVGDKLFYGKEEKSERYLPSIKRSIQNLSFSSYTENSTVIEPFDHDSTFSFNETTALITSSDPILLTNKIEGNIIIHSTDSIVVSSNAQLKHLILLAPKIRFEEGFNGTVQAMATERIICEKGVKLNYPSALTVKEKESSKSEEHGIFLQENSSVRGGILLLSEQPNFRRPIQLKILHGTVAGFIYNQGETELQGEVIGSLYTNAFNLELGSIYKNHLLDATISSKQLPKEFIMPNWLEDVELEKPVILSCF